MALCAARMKRRLSGSLDAGPAGAIPRQARFDRQPRESHVQAGWRRRTRRRRRIRSGRPNSGFRLARVTKHPCGAKRHPRSSVFSTPSESDATSIQSFLGVALGPPPGRPRHGPSRGLLFRRRLPDATVDRHSGSRQHGHQIVQPEFGDLCADQVGNTWLRHPRCLAASA